MHANSEPRKILDPRQKFIDRRQKLINARDLHYPRETCNLLTKATSVLTQHT